MDKHYVARTPLSSHFRPVTCKEISCPNYVHGWRVVFEEGAMADLARTSGRRFIEQVEPGGEVGLYFYPEQECFTNHVAPLGREAFFRKETRASGVLVARPSRLEGGQWIDELSENHYQHRRLVKGVG